MKLTKNQEEFCKKYVELGDQSAAYAASYKASNMSKKTINEEASRLMRNPNVTARVEELEAIAKKVADKKFSITAETMLRHLDILRNARIDDYVTLLSEKIQVGYDDEKDEPIWSEKLVVSWKPFSELTKEQLMCIESIKETRYGIELKLHGKEWTIEKINKHIGFYEKDNEQSKPEVNVNTSAIDITKLSPDALRELRDASKPSQ